MSMLKKVGFGVGAAIGVTLVGYLGFKGFKKLRGKKEEDVVEVVEESKDNIQKYYDDLLNKCKLTEEEVQELSKNYFNKKK